MCRSVSDMHVCVIVKTENRQHLLCFYLYTSVLVASSDLSGR